MHIKSHNCIFVLEKFVLKTINTMKKHFKQRKYKNIKIFNQNVIKKHTIEILNSEIQMIQPVYLAWRERLHK